MIKKINLIIATYAGKYYKFNSNNLEINKDKENYLKYNLLFINNNINNLSQITIMKPKINKEHIEIPDYYNFDNLNIDGNYIFIVLKRHREKYNLDTLLNLITPTCQIVEVDGITDGAACTTLLATKFIDNDNPLIIFISFIRIYI